MNYLKLIWLLVSGKLRIEYRNPPSGVAPKGRVRTAPIYQHRHVL
jgi:hypothetical protein